MCKCCHLNYKNITVKSMPAVCGAGRLQYSCRYNSPGQDKVAITIYDNKGPVAGNWPAFFRVQSPERGFLQE
jgi:hypothetical protein